LLFYHSTKAPAKDILFDLVELCRGVQHPMRGLFLRNYLSQISRDKLPDSGSEYEWAGGSVKDSIEFILQNFGEMNKLWVSCNRRTQLSATACTLASLANNLSFLLCIAVRRAQVRMQHQGAVRDRARREKERRNLRQLVGTNLVRLSEMSGVDLDTYKELVLPRILEQIVNCKDVIAQEYLMDCVVQVFPDEFHLATLDTYLSTCTQLQENVNVKDILITLMNRLSSFAKAGDQPDGNTTASASTKMGEIEMFPLFHKYTSKIIDTNPKLTLADTLSLQVALLNFATKIYPNNIGYVDEVLGFSVKVLQKQVTAAGKVGRDSVKQVTELLTLPLDALSLAILNLEHYGALLAFLELDQRKQVAVTIISAVVKSRTALDTVEKVDTLFKFIAPVIRDESTDAKPVADDDRFEFDQEQHLVARMFQLITHADTDVHYTLYSTARKHFGQGGTQRIEYTLPALVFGSLALSVRVHAREEAKDASLTIKTKKLMGFVHETISVLTSHFPELALRLFVQAAQTADRLDFEAIAYEFVAQAFIAYEDEVSDSKAQYAAINLLVASLQTFGNFSQENYDTLVSKATQHCAKLLKKTDQCRAVYNCAHLFWPGDDAHPGHRDEKRVLACLQRSLKIANACMGQQVHLFIEILNKYLYFFDRKCPSITVKYLKGLISLIEEHIRTLDTSESSRLAKTHYENTLSHMKLKSGGGDETALRYLEIDKGDREASTNLDSTTEG
jgi:vacuolar protein sorting-associated protein 35